MKPALPQRRVLLVIVFAFMALPVMLCGAFAAQLTSNRQEGSPWVAEIMGVIGLLAAIGWSSFRLKPQLPQLAFQTETLICLSFAEFASLMGIFIGAGMSTALPLVIGTIVVDLLFVVPRVVAFIRSE